MEHFEDPQNRKTLPVADGVGVVGTPGAGPYFVVQVVVTNGRVDQAVFQSHTCGVAIACGSVLTSIMTGKTIDQCLLLTSGELVRLLERIPPHKLHVPEAAINAMRLAIEDCRK